MIIIFFQKNFTLSFEFLKVSEQRFIYFLNTVDDDSYKDVIRIGTFLDEQINIVSDSF